LGEGQLAGPIKKEALHEKDYMYGVMFYFMRVGQFC